MTVKFKRSKNYAYDEAEKEKIIKELTDKTINNFSIDQLRKGDDFLVPAGVFKDKKGNIEEVRNNSIKIKLQELGVVVTIQL